MRRLRAILLASILVLSGCFARKPPTPQQPNAQSDTYDIVIKGGTIIDGSGAPGQPGDIGINGESISAVGKLGPYNAKREINAVGLTVAPGFINPHSHTHDFINPYEDLDATASLMQGITTEFGGVDGRSPIPINKLLSRLETEGTGVNFGLFVGQGSIRGAVMGNASGPAGADQLDAMKSLTRESLDQGAFGVSTGLEYLPGKEAGQAEIAALVAEAKPYGGLYSTHMRSEGDAIVEALQEALGIAQQAGVPLNISHFKIVKYPNWGKEDQLVARVEGAIQKGQKVFADVYPYTAPDYAMNRPLVEWYQALPADQILITRATDKGMVGKTLADVANSMNMTAAAAAGQLISSDPIMTVVAQITSEQAMIRFFRSPWSVVSTDGESQPKLSDPVAALQFHPRSYGSYPRLLGYFVRERQIVGLEAMIRKMSGGVADNLGVVKRGYLRPGHFADVVLFDPATIADRTSWLSPQEYPAGIRFVIVNGQIAVDQGRRVVGRPGKALRHGK